MKRLSIIAVTAIAALLSASCNKSIETPMVPAPQGSIILDLDIAGFEGTGDTKAVKNGWANGDKLNLWFDDWNTEKVNNPTPDLVITYDGTKWTAGELAAGRSLKSSGKFSVLYEGGNDLSASNSYWHSSSQFFEYPAQWVAGIGERVSYYHMIYRKEDVSYTYSGNKLTATISGWKTPTPLKVSVKGLNPAEAKSYILQTADVTTSGTEMYPDCIGAIVIDVSDYCPTFSLLVPGSSGCMGGVPDADGVAFYYNKADFTDADIEFRLFKKNASGNFEGTANAPKFTGKTLVTDDKKTIGIVIDKSKFE